MARSRHRERATTRIDRREERKLAYAIARSPIAVRLLWRFRLRGFRLQQHSPRRSSIAGTRADEDLATAGDSCLVGDQFTLADVFWAISLSADLARLRDLSTTWGPARGWSKTYAKREQPSRLGWCYEICAKRAVVTPHPAPGASARVRRCSFEPTSTIAFIAGMSSRPRSVRS